jgi:DNA (cytosine-5)-methyltransferase 1
MNAVDLFAGCGGFSTGLADACAGAGVRLSLVAVDNWHTALATHALNHPDAAHAEGDIAALDPRAVCPDGVDLMLASPPCTEHSKARGGKACPGESRDLGWEVVRWARELAPKVVIVENVPRWENWGPLDTNGKPLKAREGEHFQAWLAALAALGYRCSHRVLCAADHGEATTRRRLFVVAVRDGLTWRWPEPTHAKEPGEPGLFGPALEPWRGAREIIDWSIRGTSIFARKKPLSDKTLARIEAGLRKFGGSAFAEHGKGGRPDQIPSSAQDVAEPLDPVCAQQGGGGGLSLAQPFTVCVANQGFDETRVRSGDSPVGAITGGGVRHAPAEPFVLASYEGTDRRVAAVAAPVGTVRVEGKVFGLAEPFIVPQGYGERDGQAPRVNDVGQPLPHVVGSQKHPLVEPFILSAGGPEVGEAPTSGPHPTVLTRDHCGLVEPFVLNQDAWGVNRAVDAPVPTTATDGATALVLAVANREPERGACEPLGSQACKARFTLLLPHGADVLFRMLQPHELAAAQGFPPGYRWAGTKTERVKQIGNSVCVRVSAALCASALRAIPGGPS